MEGLPLILTDDPHQVIQQLVLLACADRTCGSFIQQAFHAPKQSHRPFEGNQICVVPAHVCETRKISKEPQAIFRKGGGEECACSHFLKLSNPSVPSTSRNRPVTSLSLREPERAYPRSYS